MEKFKKNLLVILEGVFFGALGGLFLFISLYLFHYFTFTPPGGKIDIHVTPLYRIIVFPPIILFLSLSFMIGKEVFKLLKKQNLQWVYNLIFFMIFLTYVDLHNTYFHLTRMSYEMNLENFESMGFFRQNIIMFLFLLLYSFLYQIIKTRIFSKTNTIC